ncbi:MAG: hypothetical protein QF906_02765 [Dehalococcoidales bacterium]|nr:hypothetical protein [Dehalococcoidales bacterium]
MKIGLMAVMCFILLGGLGGDCSAGKDFDARLRAIVKPYRFSIVGWEVQTIFGGAGRLGQNEETGDEVSQVNQFFTVVARIKTLESEIAAIKAGTQPGDLALLETELGNSQLQKMALAETTEKIIEKQVREILNQQDIFNPIDKYLKIKVGFPPMNFKLENPPNLLVLSPRERIASIREIALLPGISLEEMENLETEADKLGVSSLVVELGGFGGTYPSFVTNKADLSFTVNTATEEWLHQYLTFKPLGFRYLLDLIGIFRNYEIATMNETVAGMVSKEIGTIIYETYYSQSEELVNTGRQAHTTASSFDFNREMRNIRRVVDRYLVRGEIEAAEEFMEQKRQYLATKRYHIRKLNQAYFAFHGAYADSPTSISPIGIELKKLRDQSASLKDFLETAATMTNRQDLILSIK